MLTSCELLVFMLHISSLYAHSVSVSLINVVTRLFAARPNLRYFLFVDQTLRPTPMLNSTSPVTRYLSSLLLAGACRPAHTFRRARSPNLRVEVKCM